MDTISLCSLLDINITDFKNTFNEIKKNILNTKQAFFTNR